MKLSKIHKDMYSYGLKHLGKGWSRSTPVVIKKAKGCWVWDIDGNKYLDFTSGIAVLNTGHCHDYINQAVIKQLNNIVHCQVNIAMHTPLIDLIKKLEQIVPKYKKPLNSYLFSTTGAEAVENAIKLARRYTKKTNILCATGSFHGRTNAALACTSSKVVYNESFGPFMPGVYYFLHPHYRLMPKELENNPEKRSEYCLEQLKLLLKQQCSPNDTACLILEPILGEGGYVVPPTSFLKGVQEICRNNNILLIIDEIQTGFGRTGKFFAIEHYNLEPDILIIGKGLASGYPLSAIISRKEITDSQLPGSMGGTFSGNSVSCSAAVATIEVFQKENILKNCDENGKFLYNELLKFKEIDKYKIKQIRGKGLMIAIEFDSPEKEGYSEDIIELCFKKGLILTSASTFDVIRFIPPLNINKTEIVTGIEIFKEVLEDYFINVKK